tara:strand:+ start:763 stop:1095 length:333 start_codon:yes stop_codon:yes gene_type:complete
VRSVNCVWWFYERKFARKNDLPACAVATADRWFNFSRQVISFDGAVALLPLHQAKLFPDWVLSVAKRRPSPTGTEASNVRTRSSFRLRSVSPVIWLKNRTVRYSQNEVIN